MCNDRVRTKNKIDKDL